MQRKTLTHKNVSQIPESPPEPQNFMQQLNYQKHSEIQKWAKSSVKYLNAYKYTPRRVCIVVYSRTGTGTPTNDNTFTNIHESHLVLFFFQKNYFWTGILKWPSTIYKINNVTSRLQYSLFAAVYRVDCWTCNLIGGWAVHSAISANRNDPK